jgi:AcrR family transcriptional regulator
MARPRTVNREQLLDAAEEIVSAAGAAALSFGGVATAAGLSKATVQSVFGTREAMIEAMLERWLQHEGKRFEELAGLAPSLRECITAHIRSTAAETPEAGRRMAALQAALTSSGYQSKSSAQWYSARIGNLTASTPEERRLRIAFLAAEGAFFVRHMAGIPISDALWEDIFADLKAFSGTA